MLKLADLAGRADFIVGPLSVSPARRLVEGPAGKANLEPIVMKVFLLLLDARGSVVTRDELFGNAWGGVFVGDDSLNRAIARVRKIASETAPGLFEIETIPRTGYRLTGEIVRSLDHAPRETVGIWSRRGLIAGGAAAAAITGSAGLWWARSRSDPRFDAVMARGDEAFRNGSAFENASIDSNNSAAMVQLYRQAVRLNPRSARAWGLLAYFQSSRADDVSSGETPNAVAEAQAAMRQALELDPKEPNARVAMFLLQGSMFDWATRDRNLRGILATDPDNIPAMLELMPLLQAAGLTRESWTWNERILKASPFLRPCLVVRSMKLWIMGRVREADEVIARVLGLWPDYWFANYARFNILALTDRPRAARAIPDGIRGLPAGRTRSIILDALELRTPAAIEAARAACVEAARHSPQLANGAIMYLCALGLADTAFELTEGFLLWRGKMISAGPANGKEVDEYSRRMTQWLFTPPVAVMRADPRFLKLCSDFGLTSYWRSRGVRPDYQAYG
jgi:DNA-binding winged helix-turn-helix (wHTH) protein/tetratricopeptide (TPR) repeat protein